MSGRRPALLVLLATAACSGTARSEPRAGRGSWEMNWECRPIGTVCAGRDLPRITEHAWRTDEIAAFVARSAQGTTAVDHGSGETRILAECHLDGRYHEIVGKPGSGRFWVSSRPLFRVDEVPLSCAQATHTVAAFARKGPRFEALLMPLPCPSLADPKPAPGCIGRGLTGAERLEKGKALQARLEPVPAPRPAKKPRKRHTVDDTPPPPIPQQIPSAGWLFNTWALTPDDYQAIRWLPKLANDCPLATQASWLASYYANDSQPGVPARPSGQRFPPLMMIPGFNSTNACEGQAVFLNCFPELYQPASDSLCFPK